MTDNTTGHNPDHTDNHNDGRNEPLSGLVIDPIGNPLGAALELAPLTVVYGPAGVGLTHLMAHVAAHLAQDTPTLLATSDDAGFSRVLASRGRDEPALQLDVLLSASPDDAAVPPAVAEWTAEHRGGFLLLDGAPESALTREDFGPLLARAAYDGALSVVLAVNGPVGRVPHLLTSSADVVLKVTRGEDGLLTVTAKKNRTGALFTTVLDCGPGAPRP